MNSFIDKLRAIIIADDPDADDRLRTIHLAAAALLYEVAMSDQHVDDRERDHIEKVLGEAFELSESEAAAMASEGRAAAEESVSLHGFTSLVREHWSVDERCELMDHLWAVVWADGRLDAHEQHLMRKLASLLYIPHKRYVAAKLRALEVCRNQTDSRK